MICMVRAKSLEQQKKALLCTELQKTCIRNTSLCQERPKKNPIDFVVEYSGVPDQRLINDKLMALVREKHPSGRIETTSDWQKRLWVQHVIVD